MHGFLNAQMTQDYGVHWVMLRFPIPVMKKPWKFQMTNQFVLSGLLLEAHTIAVILRSRRYCGMFEHFGSFLINFFFLYKGNGVMNLALQADLLVRCLIFFSYSREAAMALNSLYSDGWFALGAAALKARDLQKALDAFTLAVHLDPDNWLAWNNIASL
jgi:tetratricopeptide (TPR) repeat protein